MSEKDNKNGGDFRNLLSFTEGATNSGGQKNAPSGERESAPEQIELGVQIKPEVQIEPQVQIKPRVPAEPETSIGSVDLPDNADAPENSAEVPTVLPIQPDDEPEEAAAEEPEDDWYDEDEEEADEEPWIPRRRSANPRFRVLKALMWLGIMLSGALFLSIFLLESASDIFGFRGDENEIQVVVPADATHEEIVALLKDRGIISQTVTFNFYAKLRDAEDAFLDGTYYMRPNMSYDEIIALLKAGNVNIETVWVVIPEGLNVSEIAALLEEGKVCDADEFLDALQNEAFSFEFIDLIPTDSNRLYRLEGYIFPDSYEFYVGEKPASVIRRFLTNFNSKVTSAYYERMEELGLTMDETITLASIIQKEAGEESQMYRVSSVFHNRLDAPDYYPRLQSDTTTNYIRDYIEPSNRANKERMIEAYDTFTCTGLPAGPITNPGLDAIKAALYPANTTYYFFVSDANGEYYYASNYDQHQYNIAVARAVSDEVAGTGTHD